MHFTWRKKMKKHCPATVIIKNFSLAKGAKISIFATPSNLKWQADGNDIESAFPKKYKTIARAICLVFQDTSHKQFLIMPNPTFDIDLQIHLKRFR